MNILNIISSLDPSLGGAQEALLQISRALLDLGHRSEVVTLDEPNAIWLAGFPGIVHALGPSLGKYRFNRQLIRWMQAHSSRYDAVLVHGIWQFHSFGVWLADRSNSPPYFVFVHGALDPWFKRTYPFKHIKKWFYWPWAEYRALRDARAVLFTCEAERILARKSFWLYRANEAVVGFGIRGPDGDSDGQREQFYRGYPYLREKRLMLFLSRIHRIKGCDLLIEAFSKMASRDPALVLVMAGPDQEGWQQELMTLAKASGVERKITWTGMLTGDMKWGALHAAEVFVLPSHSENFGIVVVEALACGLPVLITDKVNIWREIVQHGAGIAEPDTLDGTVALLERWLQLPADEMRRMRTRAKACYEKCFEIHRMVNMLIEVIEQNLIPTADKVGPSGNFTERAL